MTIGEKTGQQFDQHAECGFDQKYPAPHPTQGTRKNLYRCEYLSAAASWLGEFSTSVSTSSTSFSEPDKREARQSGSRAKAHGPIGTVPSGDFGPIGKLSRIGAVFAECCIRLVDEADNGSALPPARPFAGRIARLINLWHNVFASQLRCHRDKNLKKIPPW